jgi:hypothetical protein
LGFNAIQSSASRNLHFSTSDFDFPTGFTTSEILIWGEFMMSRTRAKARVRLILFSSKETIRQATSGCLTLERVLAAIPALLAKGLLRRPDRVIACPRECGSFENYWRSLGGSRLPGNAWQFLAGNAALLKITAVLLEEADFLRMPGSSWPGMRLF